MTEMFLFNWTKHSHVFHPLNTNFLHYTTYTEHRIYPESLFKAVENFIYYKRPIIITEYNRHTKFMAHE